MGSDDRAAIKVVESLTEEQREQWERLARRLVAASPEKWTEVLRRVSAMVEAQEIVAEADDQIFLRVHRPTKRYRA